jgi:hypothetical protein
LLQLWSIIICEDLRVISCTADVQLWRARSWGRGDGIDDHISSYAEKGIVSGIVTSSIRSAMNFQVSRNRVTRLCSTSLCTFPCNETNLILMEKYCKLPNRKIRQPSKYKIIWFENLSN